MREYVFSQPQAKKRLEQILHPMIRLATEDAAKKAHGSYTIFVVPLLVESGKWQQRVSRVLVVDCSEATQIQRVMSRDHLTPEQIADIMQTQANRQQRLQAADDVIINEGNINGIRTQVGELHEKYLHLARAR